eukprot:SAG11_NODE_408_length_9704_cov_6.496774_3_plen_98_part_00
MWAAWCWMQIAWQQMVVENRRMGLIVGEVEESALCGTITLVWTRLWLAWKHQRWWRQDRVYTTTDSHIDRYSYPRVLDVRHRLVVTLYCCGSCGGNT